MSGLADVLPVRQWQEHGHVGLQVNPHGPGLTRGGAAGVQGILGVQALLALKHD